MKTLDAPGIIISMTKIVEMAWLRDSSGIEHSGEALLLACLLNVKKGRNYHNEEQMKDILVFKNE